MIELTRTGKQALAISNPVMPASGTFGYDGSAYHDLIDLTKLGALVTNPVTWKPRRVANGPRVVSLPSGVLVHTGLPNPGMRRVIQEYAGRWTRSPVPVIVHIAATTPDEVGLCAEALEHCEGAAGIELGLHDQATSHEVFQIVQAAQNHSQLPLLVRLPLYSAVSLAHAAQDAGAGGLVVAAPPRGTSRDTESGLLAGGRLYGPWLAALTLRAVGQIAPVVQIPVIGSGGIHSAGDARSMIEAGAVAVQVDSALWVQPRLIEVVARNLGGLELTRTAGALADEWEPGIGLTMIEKRRPQRPTPPPPDHLPE